MNVNSILRWNYVGNFLPSAVGLHAAPFEIWPYVLLNLLVFATGSVAGLACVWAALVLANRRRYRRCIAGSLDSSL